MMFYYLLASFNYVYISTSNAKMMFLTVSNFWKENLLPFNVYRERRNVGFLKKS